MQGYSFALSKQRSALANATSDCAHRLELHKHGQVVVDDTAVGSLRSGVVVDHCAGVAAQPDLINTTCTYPQFTAALNAQAPDVAQELSADPLAQMFLQQFLAALADQRQRMITDALGTDGQQATEELLPVLSSCINY